MTTASCAGCSSELLCGAWRAAGIELSVRRLWVALQLGREWGCVIFAHCYTCFLLATCGWDGVQEPMWVMLQLPPNAVCLPSNPGPRAVSADHVFAALTCAGAALTRAGAALTCRRGASPFHYCESLESGPSAIHEAIRQWDVPGLQVGAVAQAAGCEPRCRLRSIACLGAPAPMVPPTSPANTVAISKFWVTSPSLSLPTCSPLRLKNAAPAAHQTLLLCALHCPPPCCRCC